MTDEFDEFDELETAEAIRAAYHRLQRKHEELKDGQGELVQAVYEAAHDAFISLGPLPPVPVPKVRTGRGKPEVALWHLTDWQGGKKTLSYNSNVMQARILHYVDVAEQITLEQRHPVNDGVILFGGDIIEGLFNFPQQPFQTDATLFAQFSTAVMLMVQVVRRAAAIYRKLKIIGEWGNHGRIGNKRDAIPSADNFDRMILWTAKMLLDMDPSLNRRVEWQLSEDGTQPVEIGNYRAVLLHGDEFGRSGSVARKTLVQKVVQWKSGAYKVNGVFWPFRDAYVGHYHTHGEEPLPDGDGAVYWTGSPESDNGYAHDGMATGSTPSQRLHFIDPRRGWVAGQRKIWLPVEPA